MLQTRMLLFRSIELMLVHFGLKQPDQVKSHPVQTIVKNDSFTP